MASSLNSCVSPLSQDGFLLQGPKRMMTLLVLASTSLHSLKRFIFLACITTEIIYAFLTYLCFLVYIIYLGNKFPELPVNMQVLKQFLTLCFPSFNGHLLIPILYFITVNKSMFTLYVQLSHDIHGEWSKDPPQIPKSLDAQTLI